MMKRYFFMLVFVVSACKAQQKVSQSGQIVNVSYYSDECKRYENYERRYLNDSTFVEKRADVPDTLIVKGGIMQKLHNGSVYKLIDISEPENSFHYYYHGLSAADTLQQGAESFTQYQLRLDQSIVLYLRVKARDKGGYTYYVLGECYPVTPKCLQSKLINRQYGVVHFEKDIGVTGHGAGTGKCTYKITNESYNKLLKQVGK